MSNNSWNDYQEKAKNVIRESYDSETAERTWNAIKDVKDLSGFSEWRQGDKYKQIAYDVKQLDIKNKEEKEAIKDAKVKNNGNPYNTFRRKNKEKYPNAEDATKAYNEKIQENKISDQKLIDAFFNSRNTVDEKTIKEKVESIKKILEQLVYNDDEYSKNELNNFALKVDSGRIYDKVIDCYIRGIKNKMIRSKNIAVNSTRNNFYKNPQNNNVTLYVTDNDKFEQMKLREIIPNKKKKIVYKFGTLTDDCKEFIVCYDFLLPYSEIYEKSTGTGKISLERELFKIFVHLGFMGYNFDEVPKIDDFFCDDEGNVYLLNLNNIKSTMPNASRVEIFQNQYKFISFRKKFRERHKVAFKNFDFDDGNPLDFNALNPDDNKDTDKVMEIKKTAIKDWKQVIKNSKKTFGITEKITYTPLYITGAVLAALIAVGINDMYKSFTEKPNEFSNR